MFITELQSVFTNKTKNIVPYNNCVNNIDITDKYNVRITYSKSLDVKYADYKLTYSCKKRVCSSWNRTQDRQIAGLVFYY